MRWMLLLVALLMPGLLAAEPMEVRGVNFAHMHRGDTGYGSDAAREQMRKIAELGGNWIAVTDFAYMERVDAPGIRGSRRDGGRSDALRRSIDDAHAEGLQVLLKPHIWSRDFGRGGRWVGDVAMTSEEDWQVFFDAYRQFIVETAVFAQDAGADALCIGVEMQGTSHREEDWRAVIAAVREVYDGPITYCAAFGEYQQIAWWDAIDVAGISAYWKLAEEPFADEATLRQGWANVFRDLDAFHARTNKPIVFLELGYTAGATAAMEPWSTQSRDPDHAFQARLYRVALEEAAKRDYVRGALVWKWFTGEPRQGSREPFVVQGRPAVLQALRQAWSGQDMSADDVEDVGRAERVTAE